MNVYIVVREPEFSAVILGVYATESAALNSGGPTSWEDKGDGVWWGWDDERRFVVVERHAIAGGPEGTA